MAERQHEYRVVVTSERTIQRPGQEPVLMVEFRLDRRTGEDDEGNPTWIGLVSGANECAPDTGARVKNALLKRWAQSIAPDGVTL